MTQPQDGRSSTGQIITYDQLYFAVVELRGQVSSFIAVATLRDETQRQELQRLREESIQRERDHEERIRLLEQRKYVEPKAVWTAAGLAVAAFGVLTAIINMLLSSLLP